ncbi:MAG: efflux RND transporter permease subunit [Gammaproteobacteria bacterium]|nr:efflux RND transporter permease subunit [Gammaproteobacteria bacterium]
MSWPSFSLRYRYTIFAALIAVVVFGVVARLGLPIQLFPDSDPPVVTVITAYPGVAAVDVAKNVSKVMEEEFGGINGIRKVSSTSQIGLSVVKAEFHYTRDVEAAALDVQNAISRIRNHLPQGIGEPQVLQFSSSDKPILTLALKSGELSLQAVRELADNAVRDRLQLVDGVAAVDVFGGHKQQLEVSVQRDKLRAHGLEMAMLRAALQGWNLSEPGGRIERGDQEAVVRFEAPLQDARDAASLVVLRDGDRTVRLGDVASVRVSAAEPRSAYHLNGEAAIAVQLLKREEANTVEVARRVRGELERLRLAFPQLAITVADDDSVFTELVIDNMTSTILSAIVLTIIVVLLFLAHLRQALIIAISIPVAFLMTFCLMYLAGIELHMVTMSAIILSIGLLVDDGIVVLENVHRHLLEGAPPVQAAIRGTEEIFLADLAGTLTTIAVLVPLMFLGGFVGELFGPLAWTLAFALSSSFVISVTLIPLLTALWLHPEDDGEGRFAHWIRPFTRFIDGLREGYLALLSWSLRHPWRTLLAVTLLLALSLRLMTMLGSEMLPKFDSGNFQIMLDTVPGTPLEQTVKAVREAERLLLQEPEVLVVSTQIGYEPGGHYLGSRGAMDINQAEFVVNLTPRTAREETLWSIMDRVRAGLHAIPGITLAVVKEKGGTARAGTAAPLDVRFSGPDPLVLDRLGTELMALLQPVPGVTNLYKNWGLDMPEVHVAINRERAAEFGLSGKQVARAVYEATEGEVIAPFRQPRDRDLEIFLRYRAENREDLGDLNDVHLQSPDGRQVPLRELAQLETRFGPRIVTREALQQTLDVLGYHYGRPLSDTISDITVVVNGMTLPDGYEVAIGGEQSDFEEARFRIIRALGMGILAVYLVLVAQFRSFKHPFTILMAVPLQFVGVALALLLAGKYLSMPALLGIILLVGTVVNNSIVLIDYILVRRRDGVALEQAIIESVTVRYRPIMMTALSDVAGMLPLSLELAVGAERFSPIATVVIGGILAATLLTLIVIPVLFMLFERIAPTRADKDDPVLRQIEA